MHIIRRTLIPIIAAGCLVAAVGLAAPANADARPRISTGDFSRIGARYFAIG